MASVRLYISDCIIQCRISSEIYVLEDLKYYNHGTSSDYNTTGWSAWDSYPTTITRTSEYTNIAQETSGTTGYSIFTFSSYSPSKIEFDLYKEGGSQSDMVIQLRTSGRSVVKQVGLSSFGSGLALDTWHHFIIDFENLKISNETNTNYATWTAGSEVALYLCVNGSTTSVRYKNFKVY